MMRDLYYSSGLLSGGRLQGVIRPVIIRGPVTVIRSGEAGAGQALAAKQPPLQARAIQVGNSFLEAGRLEAEVAAHGVQIGYLGRE